MVLVPGNCILNAADLEEINTYTFCVSVPYFFTGNNMYKTQSVRGRTWVRKDERVTLLQQHIKNQIEDLKIKAPLDTYCYACHTAFCSSKHSWITDDGTKLRIFDLTNIWKVVEDGIFEGLGINDALGVYNSQYKCVLPKEIQSPPHYVAMLIRFYKLRGSNGGK
jgi:uncharacterized protein YqjF (DUF2071 family)